MRPPQNTVNMQKIEPLKRYLHVYTQSRFVMWILGETHIRARIWRRVLA